CSSVKLIWDMMLSPRAPQYNAIPISMPHVLRIQRPRLIYITGPLDDRPTIGEDRELMTLDVEFEQEAVVADGAARLQMACHLFEVEAGRRPVRDLDGIPAAQAGCL